MLGLALVGFDALLPSPTMAQRMPGGPEASAPLTNAARPRPAAAQNAPVLSSPPINEPYTLGQGDRVRVNLFQLPDYSGDYDVQVDGTLNLAMIGSVVVEGLTIDQATALISNRYAQTLRRPIVTLNVLTRRPVEITIAGEINRPGSYSMDGADYPKLTQLFETAGGVTQSADLRNVQIRRQQNGRTQVLTANLWQLVNAGDTNQNLNLRDGDSIYIPSTLVPLDEGPLIATSNLSSNAAQPVNVAVVGEVFRPGPYLLRGGATRTGSAGVPGGEQGFTGSPTTVTDAIQVAGGIKPQANIRQIEVRRTTRSGNQEVFKVDLWEMLQAGDLRQNAILQEGDTVFIPTATGTVDPGEATRLAEASFSPNSIRINVVGEVRNSGLVNVPPNTPLNQGILAAGGFNNRAREDVVGLVRLNPDGSVTQQEISVDFAQGINAENNPLLQNNDIIIVGTSGLANFSDTLGSITSPLSNLLYILGSPFRLFNLLN
ncbi:polysaccharide biosynthesis/export family protein [Nodosilinea nodulosa]|uniref:polysaccharide biosynthesis/export family protein n=1 Tax=Nodosilinea nodulosa TaxID=416001 RepID=UPI0002F0C41B|nr:SLBB domain-containing protein [Nodosilinea nodulosa]